MFNKSHKNHLFLRCVSIYAIMMFLCLPIGKLVLNIYDLTDNSLIELQEKMEKEAEDKFEEKETSDYYEKIIFITFHQLKNISILATEVYCFNLNEVATEIVTPPPEYC